MPIARELKSRERALQLHWRFDRSSRLIVSDHWDRGGDWALFITAYCVAGAVLFAGLAILPDLQVRLKAGAAAIAWLATMPIIAAVVLRILRSPRLVFVDRTVIVVRRAFWWPVRKQRVSEDRVTLRWHAKSDGSSAHHEYMVMICFDDVPLGVLYKCASIDDLRKYVQGLPPPLLAAAQTCDFECIHNEEESLDNRASG